MNWRNITIGKRLALCFAVLVALMLLLSMMAFERISAISQTMQRETDIRRYQLAPLYVAREALAQTGIAARNAYIYQSDADAQRELDMLELQKSRYLTALAKVEPRFQDDADFSKVKDGMMAMARALQRPAEFRSAGQMEAFGRFLVEECSPLRRRIVADMDVVVHKIEERLDRATVDAEQVVTRSKQTISVIAAAMVLLSALLAYLVTRSIVSPMRDAVLLAQSVACGDLTREVVIASRDEAAHLMESLKHMQASLGQIVREVRSGTQTISTASSEVSAGNLDLSRRTEQQAESLQGTVASMEQLTATVQQNAENARQANALASQASDVALRAGQVVSRAVETMDEIHGASKRIADIVGVIDGIAFQTNILALNAAVEAARAGEQGRGFAVVAAEVRSLAQRSSTASQEIRNLIEASSAKVGEGARLVHTAGRTMQEVVGSVRQVSDIVNEISAASHEQSAGIEHMNEAICQVDQITQQNSALVEQAAAAARTMQEQASALASQVSIFRIDLAAAAGAGEADMGQAAAGASARVLLAA